MSECPQLLRQLRLLFLALVINGVGLHVVTSDACADTFAEHDAMEAKVRQSYLAVLKGLLPVQVAVSAVGNDTLNPADLRSSILATFRKSGIPLVTDKTNVLALNTPRFRVVVKMIGAGATTVVQVNSQLEEAGEVPRQGQDIPTGVVTWRQSMIEPVAREQLAIEVARMIDVTVRDFANLYAEANTKAE